jgi:hypothetical protein
MAEPLAPLHATIPTFRVKKVAHFCKPVSGGTFSSTAIEIMALKICSSASKGFPHLEARPGSA